MLTITITVLSSNKIIIWVDYRARGILETVWLILPSASSESPEVAAQAHRVDLSVVSRTPPAAASSQSPAGGVQP